MKASAVLFSLLILVLNAVPCCLDECAVEIATEHSRPGTGHDEVCFALAGCASCAGFFQQQDLPEVCEVDPYSPFQISSAELHFQSVYHMEIWQPPRQ